MRAAPRRRLLGRVPDSWLEYNVDALYGTFGERIDDFVASASRGPARSWQRLPTRRTCERCVGCARVLTDVLVLHRFDVPRQLARFTAQVNSALARTLLRMDVAWPRLCEGAASKTLGFHAAFAGCLRSAIADFKVNRRPCRDVSEAAFRVSLDEYRRDVWAAARPRLEVLCHVDAALLERHLRFAVDCVEAVVLDLVGRLDAQGRRAKSSKVKRACDLLDAMKAGYARLEASLA